MSEFLGEQRGVWWPFMWHGKDTKQHAGSNSSRQEETRDTCPPALIPQVYLHRYDGLHPTEQSS